MNKRGQNEWFHVYAYYLILYAALVLALVFRVQHLVNSVDIQEQAQSKDLAFLIESIQSLPHADATLTYTYPITADSSYVVGDGVVSTGSGSLRSYTYGVKDFSLDIQRGIDLVIHHG